MILPCCGAAWGFLFRGCKVVKTYYSQYTENMSIRKITLVVVGLTFLGMLALLVLVQRQTLLNFSEREEQSVMQSGLGRLEAVIDLMFRDLELVCRDWGYWDDTLAFVQDRNDQFVEENLGVESLNNIGIHVFAFAQTDGEVVFARAVDPEKGAEMPVPEAVLTALVDGRFDAVLADPNTPVREWAVTARGPMMLVAQAILPTDGGNSAGGILLAGRIFDTEELSNLKRILNAELLVLSVTTDEPAEMVALTAQMSSEQPRYVAALDSDRLSGYRLYHNLNGEPVLVLQMVINRTIYQNGLKTSTIMQYTIFLMTLIFGLMTILLLEWVVITPLTKLVKQVVEIGESRDASRRMQVRGNDELSRLGREINVMLGNLEEALRAGEVSEEQLRLRVNDLEMLYEASQLLLSQVDSPLPIQSMCRLVVNRMDLTSAWVFFFHKAKGEVTPLAGWHHERKSVPETHCLPTNVEIIRRTIKSNEPAVLMPMSGKDYAIAAMFPLIEDEKVAGLLMLCAKDSKAFAGDGMDRLKPFVNLIEMAVQNLRQFEQIVMGRMRAQTLSERLVEVQEDERREIARELHDEIGQILTGLKIQLDMALRDSPPQQALGQVQEAQGLTNELIGRVRQLSLDLRPAMLDDFGLLSAFQWYFERYTRLTHIEINFRHQGLEERRFASELETAAYRVTQEALTNVARYAGVSTVEVTAWATETQLRLQISDEGKGFSPEEKIRGISSRGLVGMRERIQLLGGSLTILSAPGEGTQVIVSLPLVSFFERRANDREDLAGG